MSPPPTHTHTDVLLTADAVDEVQVADELKTMLLAGHETSSMMLTWTTYLLACHPDALARCVGEADAAFAAVSAGNVTVIEGEEEVPPSPMNAFRGMTYTLKV